MMMMNRLYLRSYEAILTSPELLIEEIAEDAAKSKETVDRKQSDSLMFSVLNHDYYGEKKNISSRGN